MRGAVSRLPSSVFLTIQDAIFHLRVSRVLLDGPSKKRLLVVRILAVELATLPVNDKITASGETNMSPKHCIKRYKQKN